MTDLIGIEILTPGQHTASNGVKVDFSPADLKEIADSYNPRHFRAPLIVSHDTHGIDDSKLAASDEFSYGIPNHLKVVGGKLKAFFDKVAPEFTQWVRDKKLHSISPSIYLRDSGTNPYPGRLSLRHIAALGKTPPAIKGLAPLSLSEMNWAEDPEGVVSFSSPVDDSTVDFCACEEKAHQDKNPEFSYGDISPSIPVALQRMRDFLISKFNLEVADSIFPSQLLENLRNEAMQPKPDYAPMQLVYSLQSQVEELQMRCQQVLETPEQKPTSPYYPYTNYSEIMNKNFGKTLSRIMKDADIDAVAGAEATGLDEADISAFMAGEKVPSESDIEDLATALGADVEELKTAVMPQEKSSKSSKSKPPAPAQAADMSELDELREQLKLAQLEATHAKTMAQETNQKLKRTELVSFCEDLVRDGRLLPAQSGTRCLDFGEGDEDLTLVDFMCGLDEKRQLPFMKNYLETQPVQVDFSEVASPSKTVERQTADFSAADGYSVDSDRADEYKAVLNYCQQHNLDPKTDFLQAARIVLKGI